MPSIIRAAAMLVLVLGTGCVSSQGYSEGPYPRGDRGLRAMLLPDVGTYGNALRFQINQAAYVAVFRIVPGYGTSMLYPRPGYGSMDGHMYSGVHRIAEAPWGSSLVSYGSRAGMRMGSGADPEFYLLVASERPLRTDQLGMYGYGGSSMNFRFAGLSAFDTMESLVSSIVPDPSGASWTTDFYVHWPEYLNSSPRSGLIEVSCSGYRVWVSPRNMEEAMRMLCSNGRPDQVPPPGNEVPQQDSVRVIEPNRRAPVAPRERIASSQLQSPEQWEEARRVAIERRAPNRENVPADVGAGPNRRGVADGGSYIPPPSGIPDGGGPVARERPDPSDQNSGGPRDQPERAPVPIAAPEPSRPVEPRAAPPSPPRESPSARQSPSPTSEPSSGSSGARDRPTLDPVN